MRHSKKCPQCGFVGNYEPAQLLICESCGEVLAESWALGDAVTDIMDEGSWISEFRKSENNPVITGDVPQSLPPVARDDAPPGMIGPGHSGSIDSLFGGPPKGPAEAPKLPPFPPPNSGAAGLIATPSRDLPPPPSYSAPPPFAAASVAVAAVAAPAASAPASRASGPMSGVGPIAGVAPIAPSSADLPPPFSSPPSPSIASKATPQPFAPPPFSSPPPPFSSPPPPFAAPPVTVPSSSPRHAQLTPVPSGPSSPAGAPRILVGRPASDVAPPIFARHTPPSLGTLGPADAQPTQVDPSAITSSPGMPGASGGPRSITEKSHAPQVPTSGSNIRPISVPRMPAVQGAIASDAKSGEPATPFYSRPAFLFGLIAFLAIIFIALWRLR